ERAKQLAGKYRTTDRTFELTEYGGRLYFWSGRGGFRVELRARGDDLIFDDHLAYGQRIAVQGAKLKIGDDGFERLPEKKPEPTPGKWLGLIGEYGPDHNVLYVLEKDGKLHVLIEWFFLYPLEEKGENEYAFPDFGLYPGEKLVFTRD